ncbi:MAG: hypothetical protein KGL44_05910 [Sphingomonadales bacterium]|nr:hypothetical protein [Sphingomonadales bacterium]
MRRALVVTDESARHPFRATLPPFLREPVQGKVAPTWHLSLQDVKDFLLAYCACFIAVSVFIW